MWVAAKRHGLETLRCGNGYEKRRCVRLFGSKRGRLYPRGCRTNDNQPSWWFTKREREIGTLVYICPGSPE